MKFAFLLALLIALVAVSSAAWTITNAADETISAGALFTIKMKTSDEVKPTYKAPISVSVTTGEATLFINDILNGPGAQNFCKVGDKVVGYASVAATTVAVTLFDTVEADGVVACTVRGAIATPPSGDAFKLTLETVDTTVKFAASAPAVEVAATADEATIADWVHKVTLKFTGLAKNTLYGPITFHTKFTAEADLTAETMAHLANSDYTVVTSGVRLVQNGGVYVWAGDSATDSASLEIVYHGSVAGVWKEKTEYSIFAKLDTGATKAKESNKVTLTSGSQTKVTTAGITRVVDSKTVAWSCSFNPTAATGDFKFSISGFDAAVYTGATATLKQGATAITLTAGTTSYPVSGLDTDKPVQFTGQFTYTEPADWTSLETVECSLQGETAKATEAVAVYIKEISDAAVATDVLTFKVVLASSNDKYKGSVSNDVSAWYGVSPGDVRAFGAAPACEDASFSVSGAKDGLDLNRVKFSASASLEDGSKTKTITCTQQLLKDAVFITDKVTVSLTGGNSVAPAKSASGTVKKAETATFNQKITIKATALTSATLATTLSKVIEDLIVKTKDETTDLKDLKVDDLRYTLDTQHYGAASQGRTILFDTFVGEYSANGSLITVAFNGPAPTGEDAYVPVAFSVYTAEWQYTIEGTATATVAAFKDIKASTFLDGKTEATYVASAAVGHGLGVACNSTPQCANAQHCNNNVCTPYSHLTVAQQNALNPTDGSDSDSAMTAATVFAFALVVIALFF